MESFSILTEQGMREIFSKTWLMVTVEHKKVMDTFLREIGSTMKSKDLVKNSGKTAPITKVNFLILLVILRFL